MSYITLETYFKSNPSIWTGDHSPISRLSPCGNITTGDCKSVQPNMYHECSLDLENYTSLRQCNGVENVNHTVSIILLHIVAGANPQNNTRY